MLPARGLPLLLLRPRLAPLGPRTALAMAPSRGMATQRGRDNRVVGVIGIMAIAVGIPLFMQSRKKSHNTAMTEPAVKAPVTPKLVLPSLPTNLDGKTLDSILTPEPLVEPTTTTTEPKQEPEANHDPEPKHEPEANRDPEPEPKHDPKPKSKPDQAAPAPAPVNDSPPASKSAPPTLRIKYVLVGAGTASFSAMRAIKRIEPEAQVLIIGEEDYLPYQRPPLSKELWFSKDENVAKTLVFKDWKDEEREYAYKTCRVEMTLIVGNQHSLTYQPSDFYNVLQEGQTPDAGDKRPIIMLGRKAVNLNTGLQFVDLDNGQRVYYSKLLLATGGKPRTLPMMKTMSAELRKHVTTFRNLTDFQELDKIARTNEHVAIIGGGFLGSELACALAHRAKSTSTIKVTQIFPESGNMGLVFPEFLSQWTTRQLRKEGVNVLAGTSVTGMEELKDPETGATKVLLKYNDGTTQAVDHVVVSVGLEPNVDLAKKAGLEIDSTRGGVVANAELETHGNVFVAGDMSSYHDVALGRRRVEHYDHAVISGRAAGENMTGKKRLFGHQSMFWSDLGPKISYEAVGITDSRLVTYSIWARSPAKEQKSEEPINMSLHADADDGGEVAPDAHQSDVTTEATPPPVDETEPTYGVVFYLNDERKVVGMILWNFHNRVPIARRILREGRVFDDLTELHYLFRM